jgi:phosphate butyryltransferase
MQLFKNFSEIIDKAKVYGPFSICVAVAQDIEVLKVMKMAQDMGLAEPILVGDEKLIRTMMKEVGMEGNVEVINEEDEAEASRAAVSLVRNGKAQVLMKGFVNTSIFMRAVLNKEEGLRTGRLISHMATYEIPGHKKIVFCTDSGINVAPDLEQKKDILTNALNAIKAIGIEKPKVAALAANELVSDKMPVTVEAKALVDMAARGEIPGCIIEGPMPLDIALDAEIAKHKGIESRISGDVDLFFAPAIEVGNVLGKSWLYFNKAKWAGIVLGATHPIVLGSRGDTAEIKLNSIALACLVSKNIMEV